MAGPARSLLLVLVLAIGACADGATEPVTTTTTLPESTTTAPAATTKTPLTTQDIYARVSPSLAFVESTLGTGSGILIDDRLVVTNAHVVWPDRSVSVRFPNGTMAEEVSVVGVDWIADLALLDVASVDGLPPPAATSIADEPAPGSDVYLVGYPAEDLSAPEPAITAGIISRRRHWDGAGLTYIQTDALISGGQSGGALVSDRGEVIGVSGLSIGEGFALALSWTDAAQRLDGMVDGESSLGDRWLESLLGPTAKTAVVAHPYDEIVFVFEGEAGDRTDIDVTADAPITVDLLASDGYLEATTEESAPAQHLEAELVLDGSYFVVALSSLDSGVTVSVDGPETRILSDPDHGKEVDIGETFAANADYPGDLDWFTIGLAAGESIVVTATSVNIDAAVIIDLLEPVDFDSYVIDSDSAGGVLGTDARARFTAPSDGIYAIAVFDETQFGPGGYLVSVDAG